MGKRAHDHLLPSHTPVLGDLQRPASPPLPGPPLSRANSLPPALQVYMKTPLEVCEDQSYDNAATRAAKEAIRALLRNLPPQSSGGGGEEPVPNSGAKRRKRS